jgi:mono/diheme cytochrome c family protein
MRRVLSGLALVAIMGASLHGTGVAAQTGAAAEVGSTDAIDDLQRSSRIFTFQEAARSGPDRGREIYYYRCWNCHNAFTNAAGSPAPVLETLYERGTLLTGVPVTDENVADKIRQGGPLMPAFRYSMSDADIDDLVSYLSSGECCIASNEIDLPANPDFTASPDDTMRFEYRGNLYGGPTGIVRSEAGDPLEGIMVQLIASENNIRTTVYSDELGSYEFPRLPTGDYTLRIAKPLRWQPYRREDVQIDGANYLDEIVLQPVTADELLPPTTNIMSQLTGAEWLLNLPGTQEEKRTFVNNCNWCHSYQQIFRARYDESGWSKVVDRMSHYQGSTLAYRNPRGRMDPETEQLLVQWLARVRGPDSEVPAFKVFPNPSGPATELIVTEYELPRLYLATHDVAQDTEDQLWYSPHRGAHIGRVDPATGLTREYYLPVDEGCISGTHWITFVNNEIWTSQNWSHTLTRIDADTGELHVIRPPERLNDDGTPRECNRPMENPQRLCHQA